MNRPIFVIFQRIIYFIILKMTSNILFYLITALLLASTFSWRLRSDVFDKSVQTYTNQRVQYFDQILDHYSYLPPAFWKQRYYVNNAYYDPASGPVFLYICGEGPCNGVSDQSWTAELAKQTKGLILALEHRYYGESMPIRQDPLSVANLKYLSSKQALKDLAFFIEEIKRNRWHGVSTLNKWITVGGSYPGALSAWFRNKYPHLTLGAIASSAVVTAIDDYKQYDEQVFLSLNKSGDFCTTAVKTLIDYGETQSLSENRLYFQGLYKAEKLTSREFMYFWVDIFAGQVQYGRRTTLCDSLKNKTLEEMLAVIKPIALSLSAVDYGAYYLSNSTLMMELGGAGRSWAYQCCTEVGYFQTFSDKHTMRSKLLTIDFYRKWCEDLFGQGTWPSVSRTNLEYGGTHLETTNLIMSNGIEDPWKWASLQTNYKSVTAKIANCTNCAHCVDLHTPAKTDDKALTAVRDFELATIKTWLGKK